MNNTVKSPTHNFNMFTPTARILTLNNTIKLCTCNCSLLYSIMIVQLSTTKLTVTLLLK